MVNNVTILKDPAVVTSFPAQNFSHLGVVTGSPAHSVTVGVAKLVTAIR